MGYRKMPTERFWEKVDVRGPNECWPWKAARFQNGYGSFYMNRRNIRAHRYSYELVNGAIPPGMYVCHHCDNPPCCNPSHLFSGTNSDNILDAVSKGRVFGNPNNGLRLRPQLGVSNGSAVLTDAAVRSIRSVFTRGIITRNAIANIYGVSPMTIGRVIANKTWKHII